MLKGPNSAVEIQSIFPGFAGLYLPLYIPYDPTVAKTYSKPVSLSTYISISLIE